MKIRIGTVTGFEIRPNQNTERDVIMLQCRVSDDTDIQQAQLFCNVGCTYIPPIDSNVLLISINNNFQIAIASDDGLDPLDLEEGAKAFYSNDDDGVRRAQINLEPDGNVVLSSVDNDEVVQSSVLLDNNGIVNLGENSADDFVALAAKVKEDLDAIKADLDTIITWSSSHVHTGVTAGGASSGVASAVSLSYSPQDPSATKVKAT